MSPCRPPIAGPRARRARPLGHRLPPGAAPARRRRPLAALALFLPLLGACAGVGPQRLDADQMGYANALSEGLKRQMLLNMVRLRYADVPSFLAVSQLISGYTLQSRGQIGLNAYPNANPGNYATLSGTVEYTTRPTFTFTPVTGERFAQSYLRPLAAVELLSLAQSGAPVDLLFRLGVQAVNGLPNRVTSGSTAQEASGRFQALLQALREVQSAGALSLRFERQPQGSRVFLALEGAEPQVEEAIARVRHLLHLPAGREFEVVYGRSAAPGQVALLTRSVLQILYELGAQIEVAEEDVRRGETLATAPGLDGGRERLITVHQGSREPRDAFAAVSYRDRWYWIEAGDYRSKAAFAFAFVLQVLAESGQGQATPIVTIPAQ